MRAPAFWWRPTSLAARILAPAAALYAATAERRLARPGAQARIPVICIGNPVAGGAGKTPLALATAGRLRALGHAPVFLTRGYGGRLGGPLHVDPARQTARDAGDESLLLAAIAPTVLSRDRVAGARLAAQAGDVLVMDDGFQNPALRKDLSILVIDGPSGVGNGRVIPAGPLRAGLDAQFSRADALVLVGGGPGEIVCARAALPVFSARLEPDATVAAELAGKPVLAFCGIGRPQKFYDTLESIGARLVGTRDFADHRPFSAKDAAALLSRAETTGARLVTTAKDLARMQGDRALSALAAASLVVPVRLVIDDAEGYDRLLTDGIARFFRQG